MKIEILTDTDSHDCETCGGSYADGGKVIIDGVEVLNRPAMAHCYSGSSYGPGELLVMALTKLGHKISVDDAQFFVQCHDTDFHGPLEG